jgi:hypothetical protein
VLPGRGARVILTGSNPTISGCAGVHILISNECLETLAMRR